MTPQKAIKSIKTHYEIHRRKEPNAVIISEALLMAVKALEKQIPKEPLVYSNDKEVPKTHKLGRLLQHLCPNCSHRVLVRYETDTPENGYSVSIQYKNCSRCGQRIDFGNLYRQVADNEELELED